ncbi:lipopolysaccharide biosynthesis protein [Knoellia sp. CPCC 206453]|uniref:lipopolysaccharide biosynthesis protein n=1 Tax=Knoellia pratensis TaxID=3404796 RepID=UPI00361A07FB
MSIKSALVGPIKSPRRGLPTLARAVTIAASFLFTIVVGRALGAASAGLVLSCLTLTALAGMIGRRGTDLFALKHAAGITIGDRFPFAWLTIRTLQGTAVAAACFFVLTAVVMARTGRGDAVGMLIPLALSVPATGLAIFLSAVLRANARAAAGTFAEIGLTQIVAVPCVVLLATLGAATTTSLSWVYLGAALITLVYALLLTHTYRRDASEPYEAARFPGANAEMNHMASSSVLFYGLTWAPLVALWLVGTDADAGYFAATARITTVMNLIPTLQLTAALPTIAAWVKRGDVASASSLMRRLSMAALALCFPVAAMSAFYPEALMAIFGESFSPAASSLRVLGPLQATAIALGPVSAVMTVVGLERSATRSAMVCLLLASPLLVVAGQMYGAVGVSLVAGITQIVFAIIGSWFLWRQGITSSVLVPGWSKSAS